MANTKPEMLIDWYLPLLSGGEDKGMNDAGISGFTCSQHLARETVQNIIDAHNSESGKIAKAEFDLLDLAPNEIPGFETFGRIHVACALQVKQIHAASPANDEEHTEFMEQGAELLSQNSIPMLRIRDRNTVGLVGDDNEKLSRWYRLIRGQGTPNSEGHGAGTKGIGQRAPFAFSDLRMVFYSTMLPNGSVRFMGKFILCTCKHPVSERDTQNIGFYGILTDDPDNPVTSITDPNLIPDNFRRSEPGTDIYIVGFNGDKLTTAVTRAVLTDFYAAIDGGRVQVSVTEDIETTKITSGTIADILNGDSHGFRKREDLRTTKFSLASIRYPINGEPFTKEIEHLGMVKLYIHRDSEATNSVAWMRKPLIKVIQKGSKVLNEYQAVLIVDSDEGNDLLKHLEGPSHEHWKIDELGGGTKTIEKKARAKKALQELRKFIKETLKDIRGASDLASEDIPELARILPIEEDDGEEGQIGGRDETSTSNSQESPESVIPTGPVEVKVTKVPRTARATIREEGDGAGQDEGTTGGGGDSGAGGGNSQGGEGDASGTGQGSVGGDHPNGVTSSPLTLQFRSWRSGGLDSNQYRMVISADRSVNKQIRLIAVGESRSFSVPVLSARDLDTGELVSCSNGLVENLEFGPNQRRRLEVELETHVDLSLIMEAV